MTTIGGFYFSFFLPVQKEKKRIESFEKTINLACFMISLQWFYVIVNETTWINVYLKFYLSLYLISLYFVSFYILLLKFISLCVLTFYPISLYLIIMYLICLYLSGSIH